MNQSRLWSRPLAPLVAALAVGLAAPSLGLAFPPAVLPFTVAALLLLMAVTLLAQSFCRYCPLSPRGERVWVRGEQTQTLGQDYLEWTSLALPWAGCLLCFCLGQGLFQTALNPALPAHHVRFLPQNTPISLQGMVQSRPLSSMAGRPDASNWPPLPGPLAVTGSLPVVQSW